LTQSPAPRSIIDITGPMWRAMSAPWRWKISASQRVGVVLRQLGDGGKERGAQRVVEELGIDAGGMLHQPVAQFDLLGAGGLRLLRDEFRRGGGQTVRKAKPCVQFLCCRRADPRQTRPWPGREAREMRGVGRRSPGGSVALQRSIVAARAGPVSSAKSLNAMDFYEFGTACAEDVRSLSAHFQPMPLPALKYRFTAGCQSHWRRAADAGHNGAGSSASAAGNATC
jgi:hypothetical protein